MRVIVLPTDNLYERLLVQLADMAADIPECADLRAAIEASEHRDDRSELILRLGENDVDFGAVLVGLDGQTVGVQYLNVDDEISTATLAGFVWGRDDSGFESVEGTVLDANDQPTPHVLTLGIADLVSVTVH